MELARRELAEAENAGGQVFDTYDRAQVLMRRGAKVYALAEPDVPRQLNQAYIAPGDRPQQRELDPRLALARDH
jgi:hypothetical protein